MGDELYILVGGFGLIVIGLLYLKRTDPLVGCVRCREGDCCNPYQNKCGFPNCTESKKHKPTKWFVW